MQLIFLQHVFTMPKQHGAPPSLFPTMIRICLFAYPSGFPSMSSAPAISIVLLEGGAGECLREAQFKIKGD
jgi:hypothetical protein